MNGEAFRLFFPLYLEEGEIATSDPQALDGLTQGDGSNLVGDTLTLLSNNFIEVFIDDDVDDAEFNDNDGGQTLAAPRCFFGGAMIRTESGKTSVKAIAVSDLLITSSDAAEPVIWTGGFSIAAGEAMLAPALRPILVPPRSEITQREGARLVLASRQRTVPLRSRRAEQAFVNYEALAGAGALADCAVADVGTSEAAFRRRQILLPRHAIVFANGVAVETLHPGDRAAPGLDQGDAAVLERVFEGVGPYGDPYADQARRRLGGVETAAFFGEGDARPARLRRKRPARAAIRRSSRPNLRRLRRW